MKKFQLLSFYVFNFILYLTQRTTERLDTREATFFSRMLTFWMCPKDDRNVSSVTSIDCPCRTLNAFSQCRFLSTKYQGTYKPGWDRNSYWVRFAVQKTFHEWFLPFTNGPKPSHFGLQSTKKIIVSFKSHVKGCFKDVYKTSVDRPSRN